jgi:glycosyltransferase involved in cell wall biosynthesis
MRLAIGLVLTSQFAVPPAFFESYETLLWRIASGEINSHLPRHLQLDSARRIKSSQFPTDVARNEICRGVLSGDEDYLLFLDADMTFPPDLIERLIREEAPVITARYHAKRPPYHAIAFVKHRTLDGPHKYQAVHYGHGVFEIERCGAGALLIRRDVLDAIQIRLGGDEWFRYQRGPKEEDHNDFTVSEDFWFCRQVREAGFQIFCHWDVECAHLATIPITREMNLAFLRAELEKMPFMEQEKQDAIYRSTVVRGIPAGVEIAPGMVVPEYEITPGER